MERELEETCLVCQGRFMRPRRLLDNCGTADSDHICPKCKEVIEEDSKSSNIDLVQVAKNKDVIVKKKDGTTKVIKPKDNESN